MNLTWESLRAPLSGRKMQRDSEQIDELSDGKGENYPIVKDIPRFVIGENYAKAFGSQWLQYRTTQLDSSTGLTLSRDRLARCMRGHLVNLAGKKVLEAGSGAGRFTEVLLDESAAVDSFDYSHAVEANALNNGHSDQLTLVQADIRCMPFVKEGYDYVICLGVLQHTPSPEESLTYLWEMVRPGGYLVFDHYSWGWGRSLPPPIGSAENVYRPIIKRMPSGVQLKLVKAITDFWFPIHWKFRDYRFVQKLLARLSPVHFYYPTIPLRGREMYYEWALLDTHDGTTDYFKHYRNENQIKAYLEYLDAHDISVTRGGNGIEAMCRKRGISECTS